METCWLRCHFCFVPCPPARKGHNQESQISTKMALLMYTGGRRHACVQSRGKGFRWGEPNNCVCAQCKAAAGGVDSSRLGPSSGCDALAKLECAEQGGTNGQLLYWGATCVDAQRGVLGLGAWSQ